MTTKQSGAWKCPVCGSAHTNDWRLSTHIAGMARSYNEHHREWALSREPDLDYSSPGTAARMLRLFVRDEVKPQQLTAALHLFGSESELLSNLTQGYTLVAPMEMRLHAFVLQKLTGEYHEEWWNAGVSLPARKSCSTRCEEDNNRYDRSLYLNLLDLKDIIDKKWGTLFQSHAEHLENFPGKTQFLKHFETMNTLRNQIMHPLKGKPLGQDDFEFLRGLAGMLDKFVE